MNKDMTVAHPNRTSDCGSKDVRHQQDEHAQAPAVECCLCNAGIAARRRVVVSLMYTFSTMPGSSARVVFALCPCSVQSSLLSFPGVQSGPASFFSCLIYGKNRPMLLSIGALVLCTS